MATKAGAVAKTQNRERRRVMARSPLPSRYAGHQDVRAASAAGRLAVLSDQRVGGRIVPQIRIVLRQLRHDPLRERLAELDAPLIERVDAPDRPHREDPMLV